MNPNSCWSYRTKRVQQTEELAPWNVVPLAEPAEDWLAAVIRMALHASVEGIEPPPTTWDQIRRRIEASVSPLSHQGEIYEEA
jgi:hypothetical protein